MLPAVARASASSVTSSKEAGASNTLDGAYEQRTCNSANSEATRAVTDILLPYRTQRSHWTGLTFARRRRSSHRCTRPFVACSPFLRHGSTNPTLRSLDHPCSRGAQPRLASGHPSASRDSVSARGAAGRRREQEGESNEEANVVVAVSVCFLSPSVLVAYRAAHTLTMRLGPPPLPFAFASQLRRSRIRQERSAH